MLEDLSVDLSEIHKMRQKAMDTAVHRQQHRRQREAERMNQAKYCWILLGLVMLSMELVECALRDVNLIIEPPAVRRGQHVVIRCTYDLDGSPLYSAKFYRGQLEFYRYTPGEYPNTKVFPFPGIHVDVTSSNASQVLIRNVGFGISGNFSCEVTTDAPNFSTATAQGTMLVVELPEKRPMLITEHTRYEPGDVLRANCSTPPSRPRAELKFTINNMVITNTETQYMHTVDSLIVSRISLKLQLQGVHFSSVNPAIYNSGYGSNSVYGHGASVYTPNPGGLLLRCTAQIGDLYQEYKEIELGTPQKDPIPARVTLSSDSSFKNFFNSYFSTPSAATRLVPPGVHLAPVIMLALAAVALLSASRMGHGLIVIAPPVDNRQATNTKAATTHSTKPERRPLSSCGALKAPKQPLAWPVITEEVA